MVRMCAADEAAAQGIYIDSGCKIFYNLLECKFNCSLGFYIYFWSSYFMMRIQIKSNMCIPLCPLNQETFIFLSKLHSLCILKH